MQKTNVKRAVAKDCDHEYKFSMRLILGVHPATVTGICKKCGAKITVPRSEYLKTIRNYD